MIDELPLPGDGWSSYDIAHAGALYAFGGAGATSAVYRVGGGTPLHDQSQQKLGDLDFAVIGAGARVCP